MLAARSGKTGNDSESALNFFKMAPTTSTEEKKSGEKNETKKAKDPKKKEDEPEMVNYVICLILSEVFVVWTGF